METNIGDLRQYITDTVNHNRRIRSDSLDRRFETVPYIEGEPGIGKTYQVKKAAESLGIGYQYFIPASWDVGDLAGIPLIDADSEETRKTRPEYLGDKTRHEFILFMDECDKMSRSQANIMSQLVEQKRIGKHELSEHCHIVCAGNAVKDRAGGNALPRHFWNRVERIFLTTTAHQIVKFGQENNWHRVLVSFLQANQQFAQDFRPDRELNPTARQWDLLNQVLVSRESGIAYQSDTLLRSACHGKVGEASSGFMAHWKYAHELPDPQTVLANPHGFTLPKEYAGLYLVAAMVCAIVDNTTIDNFEILVNRFPGDIRGFAVSQLHNRDKYLFNCPAGQRLVQQHADSLVV